MPYSGPASALSVTGKAFAGYFDMINENCGINGRKLNMISLDDGFSPPMPLSTRPPLSAASQTWADLLLARPGRE